MSDLPQRKPRKRLTREESRAVTRGRLLESAQALFALKGYEGVSVDEIARDGTPATAVAHSTETLQTSSRSCER